MVLLTLEASTVLIVCEGIGLVITGTEGTVGA